MVRRVFPLRCPSCGRRCAGACEPCWSTFGPSSDVSVPLGLDDLRCNFAYDGPVRRLVLAAKATPAHGWLSVVGRALPEPPMSAGGPAWVVTWATGSRAHRRRRGYDPAERLARAYGRERNLTVAGLLVRNGGPQEGRSAEQRASLGFVASRRAPRHVIVVDDVVTTGITMSRAATALRAAGAETVIGVCFARRELAGRIRPGATPV